MHFVFVSMVLIQTLFLRVEIPFLEDIFLFFGTYKRFVNVDFAFKDKISTYPPINVMQTAFANIYQNMAIFFDSKQ